MVEIRVKNGNEHFPVLEMLRNAAYRAQAEKRWGFWEVQELQTILGEETNAHDLVVFCKSPVPETSVLLSWVLEKLRREGAVAFIYEVSEE